MATSSLALLGAIALSVAACAKPAESNSETKSVGSVIARPPVTESLPPTRNETDTADQARLSRLEREARAIVKTDSCTAADQCRTAPVGWRACGGPRTYVVYCAATTDTVALFRKLKELENAEKAYNAKHGLLSTCEFRMPPPTRLEGRRCREVKGGQQRVY